MKKVFFALIVLATISFASCNRNANNQEVTEETVETTIDSACVEENENDTVCFEEAENGDSIVETETLE